MSQRAEKYARHMERRVDKLDERESRNNEVAVWRRGEVRAAREGRRHRREIERAMVRKQVVLVIAMVLAAVALIVAINAMDTERAAATEKPTEAMTAGVWVDLVDTAPVDYDPWALVALYRTAKDRPELERIEEALLDHGYFSLAVPLPFEYQDYMRTYCHLYGCPYLLALAVADWETRGQFNMDAAGTFGEVGIFQLNPGPGGAYHAELETATGLDPTTTEGNIAGGCYLLGKYLAQYEDTTKAAMAYNMGQAGAESAWEAGITSTSYTDAVLNAMEMWECTVNTWAGE